MIGVGRDKIEMRMGYKWAYIELIDRLWRTVGARLLLEAVAQLKAGASVAFGEALLRDTSVTLVRRRIFRANQLVDVNWKDVRIWSKDREFMIGSKTDKKIFTTHSYWKEGNVPVLENLLLLFFEKPHDRISQIFE